MDRAGYGRARRTGLYAGALALVLALVVTLVVPISLASDTPGVAAAQSAGAPLTCPDERVPATAFRDTLTTVHRASIDCAAWWGITSGLTPTTYAPGRSVTRGQTAAMLYRLLDRGGQLDAESDEPAAAGFPDTVGHTFEVEIAALAGLGILEGETAERFAPNEPISRAQMATVVAATIERGFGAALPPAADPFDDVAAGNVHREAIGALAERGIVGGTSATTFAPGRSVDRAQQATFLTRVATLLEADGHLEEPTQRPDADDAYHARMRAAWVHLFDDALKSRAGIRTLVDELVEADATAVIAQVARRHDAYYRSEVLTRTVDPRMDPDLDVLAELTRVAHAAGIEVHAWFGIAPTWHRVYGEYDDYEGVDAARGWLPLEHGAAAPEDEQWVTRTYEGQTSSYLDPGVPEVQDHVRAVVAELASSYDVDGIHLDYVRYPSAQHGYNPKALASFRRATGRSDTPLPTDREWSDWRRDQSRELVRAAADGIAASGRDVTLSAAVITWGDAPSSYDRAEFRASSPYTRTLQDWDRWVRDGDLDVVFPMNYFLQSSPDHPRHPVWFAQWQAYERALAAEFDTLVVPGPAGFLNSAADARQQISSSMRADGAAMYSYQQPTDDGSRAIWRELADSRWGYHPDR